MSLLNRMLKKSKDKKEDEPEESTTLYSSDLEEVLAEKDIPYESDEDENGVEISYLDVFDNPAYTFLIKDDKVYLGKKEISVNEAVRLVETKWKSDRLISDYMSKEEFFEIFDIYDFFDDITSKNGLIGRFIPSKDGSCITLYYNIGALPADNNYIAAIQQRSDAKDSDTFRIIPTNAEVDANGAVVYILQQVYNEAPLFFDSGSYTPKADTKFTDIVKTYLDNLLLIKRLNEIHGIEAQIIDVGKSNILFIMFQNGSALEYLTPTEQSPNGQLLLMDYDEDTTVEDNPTFPIVSRILKLPTMVKDKPNEKNMPGRNFSVKSYNN